MSPIQYLNWKMSPHLNWEQLPLLESLCQDSVWHVRHSSIFALPAILPRLSPEKRRTVALNMMLPLAEDTSSSVRIGVLEVLGEVLCTFQKDEDVPRELLDLFLGRGDWGQREPESSDGREQPPRSDFDDYRWPDYPSWALGFSPASHNYGEQRTIWNDPARPLICAFNYPAVALTLGRERWAELRDLYRSLSRNSQVKVKRTLAASLGVLAKIIGPENARTDLLDVCRASIRSEEGEVRLKAVEALEVFLAIVSDESKWDVVEMLSEAWTETHLKGWRERESVIRLMSTFIELETDASDASQWNRGAQLLKSMVTRGLGDDVASVRDAAVSIIPAFSRAWRNRRPQALKELLADLRFMAVDVKYSRRMTFVACQQQLLLSENDIELVELDQASWEVLERLGSDDIDGVRIGVARLLSETHGEYLRTARCCFALMLVIP
jgi:serine/threonine-protein phosphatase 4 regulatory subunit 1